MSHDSGTFRIAVVGGGISGLAAAHRLCELGGGEGVALFEATGRVGGVLHSERRDNCLIEHAADMFTTKEPWAVNLYERLGLLDTLIETNRDNRRAFIVHQGKLVAVPAGFTLMTPSRLMPMLKTPLLTWRGKGRAALECLVPRQPGTEDESLQSFATRRLGRETYERLVQPLIGGIYTADPTRLSMQATMSQFVELEREYGSLIRAALRGATSKQSGSGARYGMFLAPREGIQELPRVLASRLPAGAVRLDASVTSLLRTETGWRLEVDDKEEHFDAVIVATPAHVAARLLRQTSNALADDLAGIPYASVAIAVMVLSRADVRHPLDGFGYVTPQVENRKVLAASFSSLKFPGRAAEDQVIVRAFVGGALQARLLDRSDSEILALVQEDLEQLIGFHGQPVHSEVIRWPRSMPQYHVGHLDLVERIEAQVAAIPHLALTGNAYRGVGIPFCIHSGEQAAEGILERLSESRSK